VRIAYVCYWNAYSADGVSAKLGEQSEAWRAAGHEVELFCVTPAGAPGARPAFEAQRFEFRRALGRIPATRRMEAAAARWEPDVVYLRYDLFVPPPIRLLRDLPVVVELNENDVEETRLRARRAHAYNALQRRLVFGRAAGVVSVAHELVEPLSHFGKPIAVVGNAIDLDARHPVAPSSGARPSIVFLSGAEVPWQGVDKLLELAAAIPEWDFQVLGVDLERWSGRESPNVTLRGMLTRDEYEPIVARADVGIGTLALHRKRMEETSPLKTREYLAYGLPVVLAYEDTDLVGLDPWYLLRLPNRESGVRDHVDDVRAFVDRVRGRRVSREEIEPIVGRDAKEAARLEFMARVAAAQPPARRARRRSRPRRSTSR
jgi:glycosyltransferase involved in cell wall biosynthesis